MDAALSLSGIGAAALTEGIKFLYSQAGEILKRWRDRQATSGPTKSTESTTIALPDVFEGPILQAGIHFDAVERSEEQLRELRKELSEYIDETELVDPQDPILLKNIDALRQLLEAIYQQGITFRGEKRPQSDIRVSASIDVDRVLGYVAAVRAERLLRGEIRTSTKVVDVALGGQVIGVDIGTIGE
jgi:hypothetical protein